MLRQPNLEAQLLMSYAELISQLEDEVQDFPEHACCNCERKSLTRVNLSDELSHDVRPQLKSYILEQTPDAGDHVLFMCKYCRHMIKQNKLPPRYVTNGLQVVPVSKEDDDPQLLGEAKTAMHDVFDMNAITCNDFTLEERVAMLNADQRRIFKNVKAHLLHQQCHETRECECDLKPLHMFVSGVGGTGKSFLIELIKAWVNSTWSLDCLTCAIAAPTGLAAFNVGGITIHRLFQLPVEHEGKSATYWSLLKPSQKVMKNTLRHVKIFIIDEVSMVSSLNLAYIHMRLEELFGGGGGMVWIKKCALCR